MRYFPIFTDVHEKPIVIIGGGEDATRKVRLLAKSSACIKLVAARLTPELEHLVSLGDVQWLGQTYFAHQLDGAALAIIADTTLARRAAKDARARNIPVNVVDQPDLCSFLTPAIVDRDPVVIAIGTEGTGPVLAQIIKARIEALLHPALGGLATFAQSLRPRAEKLIPPGKARRAFWRRIFTGTVRDTFLRGDGPAVHTAVVNALADHKDDKAGRIDFIGGAAGDADLLTLRGQRKLLEADIIITGNSTTPALLDYARRDAERIIVDGEMPTQVLAALARDGKAIVRLLPGIVSRQSAEVSVIAGMNFDFDIVPGVESAAIVPFVPFKRQLAGSSL